MTRLRGLSASAACGALAFVTACASGVPSAQSGRQLAQRARVTVAREYWRAVGSLAGRIDQSGAGQHGRGYFSSCQGNTGNGSDVRYSILALLVAADRTESFTRLSGVVEQSLRRDGWQGFQHAASSDPAIASYRVGRKGQLRVSLGKPAQTPSYPSDVITTFSGPCVAVGQDVASAVVSGTQARNDVYPIGSVSASPIPTRLPR